MPRQSKYEPLQLIEMFRMAAALRNEMLSVGFTDNGGAIHSAERILNILGLRLCYPSLNHINDLRNLANAPFSKDALVAFRSGTKVLIEHVSPHRALTRTVIAQIDAGANNDEFVAFLKAHFQLALLTEAETQRLNRHNRSKLTPDRLKSAGISLAVDSDIVGSNV